MPRPRTRVPGGRPHRVRIRLSDDEVATLADAASDAGLTPAGYAAEATLLAASGSTGGEPGALRAAGEELLRARTALVRIGTNLNQAVAKLHTLGAEPGGLLPAVDACTAAIAAVRDATEQLARAARR